jgi:hypothetical protein
VALPNLFVIGAAKAGTTSLHYYLDQHPQIQMSANKEPNFFGGPDNGIPYPPGRVERLSDYERLFDAGVEMRGEASTDYTTNPRRLGVPERIGELVPDARFVYVVRDPIARTISHYQMRVAFLGERRTLQEALGDLSDPCSPYTCASLYASQLELYLRRFRDDCVLVVDQADLLAARRETLREIFAFLGVDAAVDSARFDEQLLRNDGWRAYSPGYARFVSRTVSPLTSWISPEVRKAVRRRLERRLWAPVQAPVLDATWRARLEDLYAGEVERLRALTGKAFPTWSL